MKTQATTTGSTGFSRVRSLLAFRHQSPVGRLVSSTVAFAIAAVLVVGSGAAYADDTAPTDPSSTTSSGSDPATDAAPGGAADLTDPTTDATTDPATDPTADPATDPTTDPATDPAADTSTSSDVSSAPSAPSGGISRTLKTLAKVAAPALDGTTVVVPCTDNAPSAIAVPAGKFEIDGNLCLIGDPTTPASVVGDADWDTLAYDDPTTGAYKIDELGDSSGFTEGSAETSNPHDWVGGHTPNSKNDIETAWGYSQAVGSDVYAYFGFTSSSQAGGTQEVNMEYNQKDPVPNAGGDLDVPDRTVGDLLFHFSMNGSAPLSFTTVLAWTLQSDGWTASGPNACTAVSGYSPAAGWCPVTGTPTSAFHSAVSSNGQFAEGSIDISALSIFTGKCSGEFGTMQMRTTTGNSWTSAMKDYVGPLTVTTPSNCGKILINKVDENGNRLAGATFSVSPNPDPTKANNVAYSITDNDAKDQDARDGYIEINPVDPTTPDNEYTVTETGAPTPAGTYMIDNPLGTSTNPQTVGPNGTASFNFVDHRIWKGLTATKTANPTYRATYHWSINKEISANGTSGWSTSTTSGSPLVKNIAPNAVDASKLFYRVTVTEGSRTTDLYKVSGTISVTNPSDNVGSMDAVVTDSLPGATCTVDGGASTSITVAKGATVDVPYVCTFASTPTAGQLAGTNMAKVEWDRSDYPQVPADLSNTGTRNVQPTATYDFANATVTEVDKTATVRDNEHTFSPAFGPFTWAAQGTTHTSDVYSLTATVTAGSCSAVLSNTATVTGSTTGVLDADSAYGKVCEGADLTITRIDARGFSRTYPWSVEKATTTPKITVADGKATGSYDVTVTAGDGVDGPTWSMTGTITVHNPNTWESVAVTSLPVTYSGGGSCAVTGESFPVSIAASGQHDFAYSCDFGGVKPSYSGDITARANWSAAAAFTTNDHVTDVLSITEANWTKTLVNDTVTVVDDNATPGDTSDDTEWDLSWATVYALSGHKTVLHYTIDLPVPDGGTCEVDTNTVKILGDGDVELDADNNAENNSADVQVCNPLGLSVTKTAVGDFTRTYPWTLEKFIGPDRDQSSETVHIDVYDHTFNYRVKATPGTAVDSDWVVSGTITVHNDNTDSDIDPITVTDISDLPDVGSDGVCTLDKAVPFDVASGADVVVNYECTFAEKPSDNSGGQLPTYAGTNSASVGWGTSGSASSDDVDVDWNAPTEVDKTLAIWDDKVNLPDAEQIGTAVWNAAHTPTIVDYTKNLTVPESTQGSCAPAQTNTAWLGGDGSEPTDLQDSTDAIICVNAGTWEVSKVNVDGDGPVPTDSDVTYRLRVHKTGGSDPKNVKVYDDLSDIAPYVVLPTQAELEAAAPAGTTVDITGNLITWTIAELGDTDESLQFTVHVNAGAYGVDLPNLVTSPGSDNCPNAETAATVDDCNTDNDTPHYTLQKSSDAGAQVMPPYLGEQGTLITYTLTVHNDSDAPINSTTMPGEQVTDDLSDVLDNATWVGNITGDGTGVFDDDHTLTWTLPEIPVDGTVTLSYQVRVAGDQWDETLTNVAHEGPGGDCLTSEVVLVPLVNPNCTTTTVTPPYALIGALKVDAETGAPLAGAEFTLSRGEDVLESGLVSDADGVVTFSTKLQPGTFTVTETKAPADYLLPADASQDVVVTEADLDNGVEPVRVTFGDPPTGSFTIAKAHQERSGSSWVDSDGHVAFGDEIKYVMTVTAVGPKVFHDATVTDYVPGWNPADNTTAPAGTKGELEAGSMTCGGAITCTSSYDAATGLITWHLTGAGDETGDVQGDVGTVEFVVRMPNLPANPAPGTTYTKVLWNEAYLGWTEFGDDEGTPPHSLTSNDVTDTATASIPPLVSPPPRPPEVLPPSLPNTGGPSLWSAAAGLVLVLGGSLLVLGDRRRRRRS